MLKLFRPLSINFKLIGRRRVIALPPLVYLSIAFAFGIWMSFRFTIPFSSLFMTTLICLGLLIFWSARVWFIPASIVFFLVLGFLYGSNDRALVHHHIFLSAPEGRISLEGTVVSVPEIVKRGRKETVSFVLSSHNFYRAGTLYPTTGKVQVFLHNPNHKVNYGDYLRLRGSLEAPKKVSNPYVFDYGSYLSHQGIFRIFRGIGKFSVANQKIPKPGLFCKINELRSNLQFRLSRLFPSPYSELAAALILGFRKNIPDEIKEVFIKTGTAHLLAISGLNISLVVALFYFVMSFLRMPRNINFVVMILFILVYTALAGANIPVMRAGIMGCMVFIGFLLSQERNLKSAFFFSFFLLLVWDPSMLFSASFQLSFLAMASLLFILPQLENKLLPKKNREDKDSLHTLHITWFMQMWIYLRHSMSQSFIASISATIGMFPVLLHYFNLFSVIGFLCNLIAIPLCTLAIALTFILIVIDFIYSPLAAYISFLPLVLLRFELWFIFKLAQFPFSYFYSPPPNFLFFLFYYGLLIVGLTMGKFRVIQKLAISTMTLGTVVFLLSAQIPTSRNIVFDLGKTEAFFISFSDGSKCLINTGRHFPNNQAYWIIRSFLMARAVHKLDGIILTDLNAVHAGGLRTILDYVRTNQIFMASGSDDSDKMKKYVAFRRKFKAIQEGDRIQFGSNPDIYIEILTVSKGRITSLFVNDRHQKMLYVLSADSDTFKLLSGLKNVHFDFIYLPHHHDSITEAERQFLEQVSARYLVSNQRVETGKFFSIYRELVHCPVLLLQSLGALEFMNRKDGLMYKHYGT